MRTALQARAASATSQSILSAPAKINLALEVVERLPSGYHAIRSVMVRLPRLADTIGVRIDERGDGIRIHSRSASIPVDATNLCHRAAVSYLDHLGRRAGVDITIDKAIPVAAGLGGGSSDAATVLIALDRHFAHAVPSRELTAIAAAIGKDLPFFLARAPACIASGMGERVRALTGPPSIRWLVVNPGIKVSTRDAYESLAGQLWFMASRDRANRATGMALALRSRDTTRIAAALYNDFETVVGRQHPIIHEVKQVLLAFGARGALMSGSGPTVFGMFASTALRSRARAALEARYPSFAIACA